MNSDPESKPQGSEQPKRRSVSLAEARDLALQDLKRAELERIPSAPKGSEQPELPPSLNIFEAIERLFSLAGIAQEPGWDLYDSNIRRKLDEVRERMQELYAKPLPNPSADEEVETPTGEQLFRQWCGNSYEWDALTDLERQRWNRLSQQHNADRFTPSKLNTKYLQEIAKLKAELAIAKKTIEQLKQKTAL